MQIMSEDCIVSKYNGINCKYERDISDGEIIQNKDRIIFMKDKNFATYKLGSIAPSSAKKPRSLDSSGRNLRIAGDDKNFSDHIDGEEKGILPLSDIVRFISNIVTFTTKSNKHLEAKNDNRWKNWYGWQKKDVPLLQRDGTERHIEVNGFPCYYCGEFLHDSAVQIDHRIPQSVRKKNCAGFAVAKVLHSISEVLTEAKASGKKNSFIVDHIDKMEVIESHRIFPKNKDGRFNSSEKFIDKSTNVKMEDHNKRYRLTDKGRTFLTVASICFGDSDIEGSCVNSLLNLVPSCATCNINKNDLLWASKPKLSTASHM